MKMSAFLSVLLVALTACSVEEPFSPSDAQDGKKVTIRVSLPEDPYTKVDFTADEGKLKLAWNPSDCIRVISGTNSQVFTISNIISDHEAEFVGTAVPGTSFDVLYPGTYTSVEEAEADTSTPVQDGNGSTAHLRYKALLSGVDTYTDFAFNSTWASAHGGSLKQAAAVKLQATLPSGVTAIKKASLRLGGKDYTIPFTGVDVSASEQKVTAFMMVGWDDIALPAGSSIPVYVTDNSDEVYSAALSIPVAKTVLGGKMNSMVNVNLTLQDFVAGDGSEENPYIIANARQLNNMHSAAVADQITYFKLMGDVNASSITNWTPLNASGTFNKGIFFDGCGYTISGLKSSGVSYASFAGVLYGTMQNVTFSGATISATSKCGVVAGFLGTTQADYSRVATCINVTVEDSEVTSSSAAGGFAGHVRGKGGITGCTVKNTTINGTSHLGGFAAIADISGIDKYEVPAIFTSCVVEDVTLNQNLSSANTAIYTGGFIGESYQAHSFIDCQVKGTTITATKAAVGNVGGFVGFTGYAGANFSGCVVDNTTTVTAKASNVGGFVGYATVSDAYNNCTTAATVFDEGSYAGGFAGYASGSAAFSKCSATGNVSGQRFTAGFVGVAENASFTDCYYSGGTVTANTTNANSRCGGFAGSALKGLTFQGCYVSNASITATGAGRIGGFAGQLGNGTAGGDNVTTSQCHVVNTNIAGAINTGGFVGVQYETVTSSYVAGGSVTANGNDCGGFSGFVQNADLTNCYTTANVNGGSYTAVGGMVGITYTSNVSYCFTAGDISGSNAGAFVGQCAQQGTSPVASLSSCIGWHASLPFCNSNTVGASITNCYAGVDGTVTSQAQAQTWPTAVWDFSGALPTLLEKPRRINAIFVGDSITWQWANNSSTFASSKLKIPFNSAYMTENGSNIVCKFHPGFFSGNGYIDKGISGQNTTQMLARFQKDVVALNPVVVVIMGGTNDLAQGFDKETIVNNIGSMAQMAKDAGIKVVLCSVTPNNDTYSKLNPKNKGGHIITLNGMIQDLVAAKGYTYCDYWTSLVASDGLALKEEYRLYDNLHPGPDGYDVMEPIIKSIINGLL